MFILLITAFTLLQGGQTRITHEILGKSSNYLIINFQTTELSYSIKNYEGQNFMVFGAENIGITSEIGSPELPALRKLFEVPEDAKIDFEIISLKRKVIPLKDLNLPGIKPRLPSVPKIKGATQEFVIDKKVYSTDMFFPEKFFEIRQAGIIRGHELAQFCFYPVRYNPVKKEIIVATELKVKIVFTGGNSSKTLKVYREKDNVVFKEFFKHHIINYPLFNPNPPPLPIGLLIIVPDEWVNKITSLVNWIKINI